jgi:nitric oxide reductase subunit B
MFFLAVAFWNIVGAGMLGFLINPPLSLYYMQGLNLTPLHAHTALFRVYGMLGIGLVLFCRRGLKQDLLWSERLLKTSFWSFNIGLAPMGVMTLLPIGTLQLLAAIDHGYWYARSAEFMQQPIIDVLVWIRIPGDIIFSFDALTLAWLALGLWMRPQYEAVPVITASQEIPYAR